ncbi:MAG: hypothetical protein O2967_20695 [Proteobacteria bacterium]|nr:hypothetical protein [Pseudomonadota bacterium]
MLQLGERTSPSYLKMSFLIAIVSRIVLFCGSMVVPIPNESGLAISPLTANTALDLGYYQWAREMYFGETQVVIDAYIRFFTGNEAGYKFFLPGPLFPSLLHVFDYGPGNTLPLSMIYLLLSGGLVAGWLWWLWRNGVGRFWLYVFAVLPTPYWFTLNVSTDLLFAGIVCAFWLFWFNANIPDVRRMTSVAVVVVLAVLLRPNSLSLLLFLSVDVLIWEVYLKGPGQARRRGLLFATLIAILLVIFSLFYMPYFYWVVAVSARIGYFGWLPEQYMTGLWPDFPTVLNRGLSSLALLAAKVLYLTGLRPSFGNTATPLVVLRILPGIIMLPGLLWLLLRANWRVRFFVVFFLAPILSGISQDRYVLPIQPVLFFYGVKAWGEIIKLCLRVRRTAT